MRVENNTTPSKLQDPGVPLVSIQIGEFKTEWALLDLGACVSIMPGALYDQYEFGPLQNVNTTVVLADQTRTLPRGMLLNVKVKVDDFCYLVDFLVLDYAKSVNTTQPTVILGRPFLATSQAVIDCAKGTLRIKYGDRGKHLSLFENATNPLVDKCTEQGTYTR